MRVIPRPRAGATAGESSHLYSRWTPYLFLLPYLLVFLAFRLGPSLFGLAMSFTRWSIVGSPEWIGTANYDLMQIDPRLEVALKNTAFFTGLTVPLLVILSLALAIFLGFRNSASYERFWEGRKLWGSLVVASRDLARQFESFLRPAGGGALRGA